MFIYRLTEPIDAFDGLTPLPDWLTGTNSTRATQWALQAVLALADAGPAIGWRGDMRHLPSVGVVPTPPDATPYLVVKQDDNGITFIVTTVDTPWIGSDAADCIRVPARPIGAWTHPTIDDIPHLDTTLIADHQPYHDREPSTEY
jgi:hypothetical protein